AFLAGRIHHKLDDEFPELTDALLGLLYPHYLAPVPSMAIVQFELDPERGTLPDGFRIERNTSLTTPPIGEGACKYRTGYPVTLWPIAVTIAELLTPPFPAGFEQVRQAGYEKQVEVVIFLNQPVGNLQQALDAQTFRLGCTPVINLFEQTAEPVHVTQLRYEYRIVPDVARPLSTEVYSVDGV